MTVLDRLTFQMCQGAAGFRELEPEWLALYGRLSAPTFHQHPDWYAARHVAMADLAAEMVFIAARIGDELVAMLPLRRRAVRMCGIPLRILDIYDPHQLASLDAAVAGEIDRSALSAALVLFLTTQSKWPWHVLSCRGVLGDSSAAAIVGIAPGLRPIREEVGGCDIIELRAPGEFLQALPRKARHNLRNRRRKLGKQGDVEFTSSSTLPEITTAFGEFLAVEASGWKGRAGTAVRHNLGVCRFFEEIMQRFAARHACDIHLLRLNAKPIAAQFCLRAGDTAHILKIGYDETFAHVTPGNLLLEYALQHYGHRGDTRFVNLMDDEPWMRQWNPIRKPTVNVFAFNPRSARALLCRAAVLFMKHSRPIYRRHVKPLVKQGATH